MAIGNIAQAFVSVRARTDQVENDIRRGFNNSRNAANRGGRSVGDAFAKGFNNSSSGNIFKKIGDGFKNAEGPARKITEQFRSFVRINYTLSTALGVLVGGISSVLSGIVSLAGAAGGAAASFIVIGNGAFAMVAALSAARLALSGVGKALSALNKQTAGSGASAAADAKARENAAQRVEDAERSLAEVIQRNRDDLVNANNDVRDAQIDLNKAFKEGREEIQQLGFEAEDAALSEKKAALELEKARETLARVQDLPPNSRARKEAELAFQEADLALRKAKDRNADLTKEQDRLARTGVAGTKAVVSANQKLAQAQASKDKTVRDGIQAQIKAEQDLARAKADAVTAGDSGGGTDPFAGLNQFQIDFVKFLASLKPKLDELKLSISEAFLPPLQTAISTLVNGAFPTIKTGLTQVGAALGSAAISIANAMVTTKNLENLSVLFKSSATIIEGLGRTIGSVWGAATGLLVAASPLAERFTLYLEGVTSKFDAWVNSVDGQTQLREFFDKAGNAAADFGQISGNILGGLGKIINANLGPGTGGQVLLDWLKEATQKFQDMDSTFEGAGGMREFFRAVAYNTKSIMQSIGALLGELIKLGANQAIGITFGILEKGAPFIGKMMNDAVNAGPAMANLIVVISEIGSLLSDTEQANSFFNAIRWGAEYVRDFLKLELVQEILKIAGPVTALAAGIGLLGQLSLFFGNLILGYFTKVANALMGVGQVLMANPIILVIAAIVAAFTYLYLTSEDFKNSINATLGEVMTIFVNAFGVISEAVGRVSGVFGPFMDALMQNLAPALLGIVSLIQTVLEKVVPVVAGIVSSIIDAFGQIVQAITPAIPPIMDGVTQIIKAFEGFVGFILDVAMPVINFLVDAFLGIAVSIIQFVAPAIGPLVQLLGAMAPVLIPLIALFAVLKSGIILTTAAKVADIAQTAILKAMYAKDMVVAIASTIAQYVKLLPYMALAVAQKTADIAIMIAQKAALIAGAVATGVATAAQWAFNAAMAANPIVLVVLAIAALIAGLVLLIMNWDNVIKFITTAWEGFIGWITPGLEAFGAWWNGMWEAVGTFLSDMWNGIVAWVTDAVSNFLSWFQDNWGLILSFFIGPIGLAIQWIVEHWTEIIQFITDTWTNFVAWLTGFMDAFVSWWNGMWSAVGQFISDTWNNIVQWVSDAWNALSKFITDGINGFMGWWNGIWEGIGSFIGTTWNRIIAYVQYYWALINAYIRVGIRIFMDWWNGVWEGIGSFIGDTWNNILNFFKNGWNFVVNWITTAIRRFQRDWGDIWERIGSVVGDIFANIVNGVKAPINWIIDMINGIIGSINKLKIDIPDWVPLVGGQTLSFNIPNIPRLALGGVVAPSRGGTLAQIAEAGKAERVEPLDANGMSKRDKYMIDLIKAQAGGSINITVNPSAGMDEAELARAISREITFQMRRGAVA